MEMKRNRRRPSTKKWISKEDQSNIQEGQGAGCEQWGVEEAIQESGCWSFK